MEQESSSKVEVGAVKMSINMKYFKGASPQVVDPPFYAKFFGISPESGIVLQFKEKNLWKDFDNMLCDIQTHLVESKPKPLTIEEIEKDLIILSKIDDENYCRGRIIKIRPDESILIQDCDTWEFYTVGQVYFILPYFMKLPFMIQTCKLQGLEFWFNTKVIVDLVNRITDPGDKVKVKDCTKDYKDDLLVIKLECKSKKKAAIRPWIMNDVFLQIIEGFSLIPRQFTRGGLVEKCFLTILEENGEAWISMYSHLTSKLTKIGENPTKIKETYRNSEESWDSQKDFEYAFEKLNQRIFLARFHSDRNFYRVRIIELIQETNEAKVQFLEFGNTEVIPLEDIMPIDFVDPVLGKIPVSTFRCFLHGIKEINDLDQFYQHVTPNVVQMIVVGAFKGYNLPIIDIYAQIDPEDPTEWIYVNQFLIDKGIATSTGNKLIPYKSQQLMI